MLFPIIPIILIVRYAIITYDFCSIDTIELHVLDTNAGKQPQMSLSESKCWYSNNC